MYVSRKREDQPMAVAVQFLRAVQRPATERKRRRIVRRFQHVAVAQHIHGRDAALRLELEARLLAGQTPHAIALRTAFPPETIQAFCDLFFDVIDRLDATSYIVRQVIGYSPDSKPTLKMLLNMAAYFDGPAVLEPWLDFLRRGGKAVDLETPAGRTAGAIDLLIAAHQLPVGVETRTSWVRQAEILTRNLGHEARSRTAAAGFGQAAAEILEEIPLPTAELAPCAYAPAEESAKSKAKSPVAPAARGAA